MIEDKNRLNDGFISLEGGVDAGRVASLIDPNQVVSAENVTFRGGHATSRPGFRRLNVDISKNFKNPNHCYFFGSGKDAGEELLPNQEAWRAFKTGRFQCVHGFSPHGNDDCLMALINGRLFKIVPLVNEANVTEIVLPVRNSVKRPIAYMVQADKWLFAQDGDSKPIIYDGNTVRRSSNDVFDPEQTEIPLGTIMSYGMGRLVVVVNERDIAFGDLYGSHDLPDPADSLPFFTERNFIAEGFDAAIPFQQGTATGAIFFPQLDTSTGNGQLMVFAERGSASFFLSLPREQWKTSQFQILSLLTTGLRGHRSIAVVNEDLWFRSDDGIRSYRQARSEPSGWAHIPLSTNVRQFLDVDTGHLLKFASAIYFDNRIIATCTPHWNQGRPYHDGMVVVDFDVLSSFGTKFRPTWDGHWHKQEPLGKPKVRISQLVTGIFQGITRAFFFGLDENDENQLYEFTVSDRDDWDGLIEWEMVSRAFDFKGQTTPFEESELYDGDLWLRDVIE
jgi:hypothetical protein